MSDDKNLEAPQTASDNAQEDTEAILSRRRFLIQSGLAGAGLAVAGCDKGGKVDKSGGADPMGKPHKPGVCLMVASRKPDAAVSQPCLSTAKTKPPMEPPMGPDKGMRPRVCLKVRAPMKPRRKAMVCLSKPKPRNPKPRKRPRGRICLSEIE